MVRGPTLLGTAISGLPVAFVRATVLLPMTMVTLKVCCKLRPAAPAPLREVIAGGTMGVPGLTGGGELGGASIPLPAPTKPVNTLGARMTV